MATGNWNSQIAYWGETPSGQDWTTVAGAWETVEPVWGQQAENWDELGIAMGGIASHESFGDPVLNMQLPSGSVASSEAFGSPYVAALLGGITGIATSETFGGAVLDPQPVWLTGIGIDDDAQFGTPQLNMIAAFTGIASSEAFGALRASINGCASIAKDNEIWSDQNKESSVWTDQTKQASNWS